MTENLFELLKRNPYPGRGILLGRTADNKKAVIAYFIMGRSENSRNRVFEYTEDGIRTRAFDESKMTDPSLIIYHPVRLLPNGLTVVTNGDQTDTIRDFLDAGCEFEEALYTRTFEPDGPNWTPRISGILVPYKGKAGPGVLVKLSILKSLEGDPSCCCRQFFSYKGLPAGIGYFISTYQGDGNPLPSFEGEPRRVSIGSLSEAHELAEPLWDSLNEENKVSLYVQLIDLESGQRDNCIINNLP